MSVIGMKLRRGKYIQRLSLEIFMQVVLLSVVCLAQALNPSEIG